MATSYASTLNLLILSISSPARTHYHMAASHIHAFLNFHTTLFCGTAGTIRSAMWHDHVASESLGTTSACLHFHLKFRLTLADIILIYPPDRPWAHAHSSLAFKRPLLNSFKLSCYVVFKHFKTLPHSEYGIKHLYWNSTLHPSPAIFLHIAY